MTKKPNQQDENVLPNVPIYRTIPGIPNVFKFVSDTLFSKKPVKNEEIEQVTKHIYETRVKDRSIDDLLLSNHPDWVEPGTSKRPFIPASTNMYYKRLKNILILNQKERLNFNLGKIQASVIGDNITFTDNFAYDICEQAIKFCDLFKQVKYRDEEDFEDTASQALPSLSTDRINKAYITDEFLSSFQDQWSWAADWDDQDVDEVFETLFTVKDYKKYRNFKF